MNFSKAELASLSPVPSAQYRQIAPDIYVSRAFSRMEAAGIVAGAAASNSWVAAPINAALDVDPGIRSAEVLFEELNQPDARLYRERIELATRELADAVAPNSDLVEVQLVRYHPGGRYIDHRDTSDPSVAHRTLSLVCYLNDTFSGGETVFSEPAASVSPASGIVIAFAPALLHRADPVATGIKYVITAWYHAR